MPTFTLTPRLKASGFSLVELLVLVAVVATVTTLALSAMKGLGDQRDIRICSSQLRSVYQLIQTYVADHNGRLPPTSAEPNGDVTLHWRRAILPYMGLSAEGSGLQADVFKSNLVCPAFNRRPGLRESYKGICSFGLNTYLSDPDDPKKRGIPVSRIRQPSKLFFATETILTAAGLPKEEIAPRDFTLEPTQWGTHRNRLFQNVMFADGHIELFEDVSRLRRIPYGVGRAEDVWTP